jgi:hypothetical protein
LRAPAFAVWAGEVLLVVGAAVGDLVAVGRAVQEGARGRARVARLRTLDAGAASARALAGPALGGAAVVAVAAAGYGDRCAVEALRRTVARFAPCRCVWLIPTSRPG